MSLRSKQCLAENIFFSECARMKDSLNIVRVVKANIISLGEGTTGESDVTLLTVASLSRLDRILQIAQNWEGKSNIFGLQHCHTILIIIDSWYGQHWRYRHWETQGDSFNLILMSLYLLLPLLLLLLLPTMMVMYCRSYIGSHADNSTPGYGSWICLVDSWNNVVRTCS